MERGLETDLAHAASCEMVKSRVAVGILHIRICADELPIGLLAGIFSPLVSSLRGLLPLARKLGLALGWRFVLLARHRAVHAFPCIASNS